MAMKSKDRIEYCVACVAEFAKAFGLGDDASFDYLDKHKGIDFFNRCIGGQRCDFALQGIVVEGEIWYNVCI